MPSALFSAAHWWLFLLKWKDQRNLWTAFTMNRSSFSFRTFLKCKWWEQEMVQYSLWQLFVSGLIKLQILLERKYLLLINTSGLDFVAHSLVIWQNKRLVAGVGFLPSQIWLLHLKFIEWVCLFWRWNSDVKHNPWATFPLVRDWIWMRWVESASTL